MKTDEIEVVTVTDHFQVLFGDARAAPFVDTSRLWDASGRVVTMHGFPTLVGLGTARFGGPTRLIVRANGAQAYPTSDWKAMGNFEVDVPSGRLIFWGPELEDIAHAPGTDLPPGHYEGSAFSRGEEEVRDEMSSDGPDEYLILLSRCSATP